MRTQGPHSYWLRGRGLPLLVLTMGLGLTLAYWQRERRDDDLHLRSAFDAGLREAGMRIEQRMAAHEHLLQGLRGFVEAYPMADAEALRRYVDVLPLGADFAGVQGLGLALAVAGHELDALVDRQRRMGAHHFRVWPEGVRALHAPLVQIEPAVLRNQTLLGQDLLAQPLLRQTLEAARDSGRLALSAKLELSGSRAGGPAGFLMALPIYRGDEPPASTAQRRQRLRGWVVAPVLVQDLMASLYGELPVGLDLQLYDGQALHEASLLYRSAQAPSGAPVLLQAREFLVVGGHTWTVHLQAYPAFATLRGADSADRGLLAGMVLSLLLALLAWLLATSRERALALAGRMTRALRESEQRWAFALEGAGDGVWDLQTATGSISSSARWKSIMGLRPGQPEPNLSQLLACTHPEDLPRLQSELQRCLDGQNPSLVSEYRVADGNGNGDWNWVLARATVVERDAQGRPLRLIGTLSDINARRHSEERLRFMALHDPLTELANRVHFDERMHFALANSRRYNENLGLILLDLDRFKPVNDQFGHAIGDQLLQTVAKRIKSSVRETDTVGRIGGDEFVVLLTGPVTRETAQIVADKIFNQVALPMELGGLHIEITCSLGLALYPEDGQDELSLTKAADDAMYRNKRFGRRLMGDARSGSSDGITNP